MIYSLLNREIIFALLFSLPTVASASCYVDGASERLSNYCALEEIQGARVDFRSIQLIDYKLKSEGRLRGLGLPGRVSPNSIAKALYPILSYSDNINGGNPSGPLVLSNLTFEGDEALYRKDGIVAGLGAGLSGRYIYDNGRYVAYGVNSSYAQSFKYGIGVASIGARICSVNYIRNGWYVDGCANTSRVRKSIIDDINSNISLVTSKVYSSAEGIYNEASFGVNRYFADSYTQNQAVLGYKTIHENGVYSALSFTFGEAVENQLATKFSLSGQISMQLASKPINLTTTYSMSDGGMLLGVERNERTIEFSASYPIGRHLNASVGYRKTDSTIDYFDVTTPTFGIQFAPLQF